MNTGWNYDEVSYKLKQAKFPEIDVTGPVMERIRWYEMKTRKLKSNIFNKRPIWALSVVLLFVGAVSVSAALLPLPAEWNGIKLDLIDQHQPVTGTEKSHLDVINEELSKHGDVWRTLSIEEARRQFPYPILRPNSDYHPTRSFGVVPREKDYRVNSADELWLGGFYDYYIDGDNWIVVTQGLDNLSTNVLKDPEKTMSLAYDGPWEPVKVDDKTMALFLGGDKDNLLQVSYKMNDNQVVFLLVNGNVSKEKLVKIAESYVGNELSK